MFYGSVFLDWINLIELNKNSELKLGHILSSLFFHFSSTSINSVSVPINISTKFISVHFISFTIRSVQLQLAQLFYAEENKSLIDLNRIELK